MAKIYYDEDANMSVFKGKTISVIGYGIQGRAQALNAKESGIDVVVGLRTNNSRTYNQAVADGFNPVSIEEATKKGNIIHILIPDETQAEVYEKSIKPYMKKGKTLMFSHGFNIHFKKIVPPVNVDVIMVAPKSPGAGVRKTYTEGFGTPALIAVYQNASRKAKDKALAFAKAIGATRAGVIETTFQEETETDLFGEQADLCGGTTELIKASFETLVKAGYQPEIAYFETCHELKLIVDLIQEGGIENMWDKVSNTAEYGGRTRGKRIINEHTKNTMKEILGEIQSGKFADEWVNECKGGMKNLNRMRKEEADIQIEKVGAELRKMFKKK
ncbi:MAG: ketol-acid reductoisomerase [Candidatus Altarchaeum sp. CG_4_8_14_3_um_filter_33_2054]|uniref:Ketol-acid reductoisomerase (NADP(+)) n=1 Tax=Candidatus Altarchaeum hamiconexum TaxID=1803513 RepID=A0A8J8CHH9_9ARCH|nr:ketol-acid reductoisomerase [Candidatus Altarchaeum hamiconexum]OIQ05850.1 MAG: ketol-acid reductoisomerase [Candidatus Altarchaeum sp. CG2_30_32_3053]PIX48577.1 MAG: ketol-acid reductoisomerase [Candidatus Altarchaeum sp. CG_4_8_14_3_um_filter_33_2054]